MTIYLTIENIRSAINNFNTRYSIGKTIAHFDHSSIVSDSMYLPCLYADSMVIHIH